MLNDIQLELTQSSRDMFHLDISYNDNRANDYLSDRSSDTRRSQETCDRTDENNVDVNINIYRYKFTTEFMNDLFIFSKIHQYDHRSDFKEAWK